MANKVLYRAWRSRNFDQVVAQEHVTKTLKLAIKNKRHAHAYLFVGPRGVGKTSVARIFAFELNRLDYSDKGHVDIIEIDAASNRRIDEIRELRETIHIAPLEADYKVYIIDEVHMLTREAFNALLKTLEEPPSHVVFVLATTEAHKVPQTISSRTQQFVFKPVPQQILFEHLIKIAKKEGISANDGALKLIAGAAHGSFRDGISMLDQLASNEQDINEELVREFLGHGTKEEVKELLQAVDKADIAAITAIIGKLLQNGAQPGSLSLQLIDALKADTIDKSSLTLIDGLLQVSSSQFPHIYLEVVLLKAALANQPKRDNPELNPKQAISNTDKKPTATSSKQVAVMAQPVSATAKAVDISTWQTIIAGLKKGNYSLYAILRLAEARIENDILELIFNHRFHAKRLEEPNLVAATISEARKLLPDIEQIKVITSDNAQPTIQETNEVIPEVDQTVSVVIDTFGGGEVVEI